MRKLINQVFKITSAFLSQGTVVLLLGCSTLSKWFDSEPKIENKTSGLKVESVQSENLTTFSENPNFSPGAQRQYKKTTKSKLEEDSDLDSRAGSFWVQEGQGSYLFAQNKTRREGDMLNVKLEAIAMKQVETKVKVIKTLLAQLEEQEREAEVQRKLAAEAAAAAAAGKDKSAPDLAATAPKAVAKVESKPSETRNPASDKSKEEKEDLSEIQQIQTRIIEKLADGNYKIKGSQPFMIGKKEYKVILSASIRPEDYNDEGVVSGKLFDAQYDVVSIRRKERE